MKWTQIACTVILALFCTQPLFADSSTLHKLIPSDLESRGWQAEDEAVIVSDEATLSMLINGAAPRYMELGTQNAAFVNYEKGAMYLSLEIYETDAPKSAEKLFADFATNASQPLKKPGDKSRLTLEMGGTSMLEYVQDRFYVRVSIMEKSEEARNAVLMCAEMVSDRITEFVGK